MICICLLDILKQGVSIFLGLAPPSPPPSPAASTCHGREWSASRPASRHVLENIATFSSVVLLRDPSSAASRERTLPRP